ncbi:MAG: Rne/Rng family ribonuclease [Desulfobacterota bacterium]|nr:Rne/Rng family ribonuclease [Thermodesulfobacteriota bacterium]
MIFSAFSRSRHKGDETKKMLINVMHPEESRVAIIKNGTLINLVIESASSEKLKGNIYKGIVQRVEPSLHAAFVDCGFGRPGFLPLDEVQRNYYAPTAHHGRNGRVPANKILAKDQEVIVQVTKDAQGTKAASLTTFLSLPGRYLVLMPGYRRTGISRKIEDAEERKKLKDISAELKLPEAMGVIVRTAGINKTRKELQADADYLVRLWKAIEARAREQQAPCLVYQESSMVIQAIRDYFTTDISEVLVDNPDVYRRAREFFKQVIPKHYKVVHLYEQEIPLFVKYGVEEQIEKLYQRTVKLKSGGTITIDPTEALVAIDVNTARFTHIKDPDETTLITNLEAADEIARQLRLRDLGGLIVIDFIDMDDPKDRQQVERQLRNAFKDDKANVEISRISKFGLLEMSRERIRAPLMDTRFIACPTCAGIGKVKSTETLAMSALNELYMKASQAANAEMRLSLAPDAALYLLNHKRKEIMRIEQVYSTKVSIVCENLSPVDSYRLDIVPSE